MNTVAYEKTFSSGPLRVTRACTHHIFAFSLYANTCRPNVLNCSSLVQFEVCTFYTA